MKIFRKIISIFTSCALIFSFMCIDVNAATNDLNDRIEREYSKDGYKLKEIVNYKYDKNGNIVNKKIITDEKEIKEQLKKDIINENKKQSFANANRYNNLNSSVSPMSWGDLRVIKGWTGSYRVHLRNVYGGPGGTLSASINEGFSTTLSTTTSVSNSIISSGLGISVQSSVSVNQSYSHPVSAGNYGRIDVGVERNTVNFDIQKQGLFGGWKNVGEGDYDYVIGASFRYYES